MHLSVAALAAVESFPVAPAAAAVVAVDTLQFSVDTLERLPAVAAAAAVDTLHCSADTLEQLPAAAAEDTLQRSADSPD